MKLLIAVSREITFHEIQRFSFLLFAHGRWRASLGLSSGINSPARVTGALHAPRLPGCSIFMAPPSHGPRRRQEFEAISQVRGVPFEQAGSLPEEQTSQPSEVARAHSSHARLPRPY